MRALPVEFTFAGFTFPRYVADMATGFKALKAKHAKTRCTSGYYHAPKPNSNDGRGFYAGNPGEGQPFTRWEWADDAYSNITHTGWFCDEFQDSKIRGIIVHLPHGRKLAGWSMGVGMASFVDPEVYDTVRDAALSADSMAESAAEMERRYREAWNEENN